jgi:hypothetical protein
VQLNTQIQSNLLAIANDTSAITISASAVKALTSRALEGYATRLKMNVTKIAHAKHHKARRHRQ